MAISPKDADDIRRLLECPICLERQKTPRLLPCVHTFCQECIQTFIDKRENKDGKFPCPQCKRLTDIPTDGAAGFAANHFFNHLDDCVPKTSNVFCYVCNHKGAQVEAEAMCIQCVHHLCKKCSEVHCQTGITLDHNVVSLDEVATGAHFETIRQGQKAHCPKHPDDLLKMYCEQCKIAVCLLCSKLDHDQHKMNDLEGAAKRAIDVIKGLIEPWVDAVDHAQVVSDKRRNVLEQLSQEHLTKKLDELCKIYDDFKKEVDYLLEIKKGEAITKLNEQFHSSKKRAQAAYDEAEGSRLSLMSTLRYAKKLVERAHAAETIQQFPAITATLESLDIHKLPVQVDSPIFNFSRSELPVPDLSVDTEALVGSQQITAKMSKLQITPVQSVTSQPVVKEHAACASSLNSRCEGEGRSDCRGLAVCEGGFVVTDMENKNVKVFDKHDFKLKVVLQQDRHKLQGPVDADCNDNGEIFVTDISGIVRYDAHGRLIKVYQGLYKNRGYITCHNDKLVVSDRDGGRVIITDLDCNIHQQLDAQSLELDEFRPYYACVDNYGHLVISQWDPDRLYVIDYTRPAVVNTLTVEVGPWPRGVCVDQYGHILVANYNNQIVLYNNARAHVLTAPGDVSVPTGICVSAPGHVSVVERDTGLVKTFQYLKE